MITASLIWTLSHVRLLDEERHQTHVAPDLDNQELRTSRFNRFAPSARRSITERRPQSLQMCVSPGRSPDTAHATPQPRQRTIICPNRLSVAGIRVAFILIIPSLSIAVDLSLVPNRDGVNSTNSVYRKRQYDYSRDISIFTYLAPGRARDRTATPRTSGAVSNP